MFDSWNIEGMLSTFPLFTWKIPFLFFILDAGRQSSTTNTSANEADPHDKAGSQSIASYGRLLLTSPSIELSLGSSATWMRKDWSEHVQKLSLYIPEVFCGALVLIKKPPPVNKKWSISYCWLSKTISPRPCEIFFDMYCSLPDHF